MERFFPPPYPMFPRLGKIEKKKRKKMGLLIKTEAKHSQIGNSRTKNETLKQIP